MATELAPAGTVSSFKMPSVMTYTSNFLPIIFKVAHKKISMTRHIISISVREVAVSSAVRHPKQPSLKLLKQTCIKQISVMYWFNK
jgi:hypothetical protein